MQLVIFADDLTGANDTAAQFAREGFATVVGICPLSLDLAHNNDCEVLVFDTESRDIEPGKAARTVSEAFDCIPSEINQLFIYKKVDSTLRGNVGVELQALMERYQPSLTVFAPAFADAGRTTVKGSQLLNGVPLEKTELARVPKSPVTTSYIPDILGKGTDLKAEVVTLEQLHAPAALRERIAKLRHTQACPVIVCDAQSAEDLRQVVSLFKDEARVLYAGSAGLARELSSCLKGQSRAPETTPQVSSLLYLSGSISEISRTQCATLIAHSATALVKLDVRACLQDPAAAAKAIAPAIVEASLSHQAVLVSGALDEDDVAQSAACARELKISFFEAGERMALTMAAVMQEVSAHFDAFVMTGGDTAVHACQAVRAGVFAIRGEIESGIASCTIASGPCQGRVLITKAGAFGTPSTFLNVFQTLLPTRKETMKKPVLGITMGDAAGIGSEITVKSLVKPELYDKCVPVVFGDAGQIRRAIRLLGLEGKVSAHVIEHPKEAQPSPERIEVIDLHNVPEDVPFGQVNAACGKAAYEFIAKAVSFTRDFSIHAVVTAPLNKEALHAGGCPHPGHTEILANLTGTKDYSMMLVGEKLRVIHVSTHVSLRKACDTVKKDRVLKVIHLANDTLKLMGFETPRIAVAGLNPHCGEGGLFGTEDMEEIVPAVKAAQEEGINVQGPIAPDTVFHRAANKGEFDIVVVMYHDQGHIPLKVLGFSTGVNVTVGLPCIRTSVDHGTAFEIAGKGIADCASMDVALDLGAKMAATRFKEHLM
ncbi:MAG TPA: 4-hydroxythreonine-4-phosphate dehydrogenase PdxA [Candidatus Avisuccinivibrio pullicola]|nr:4-hydroxythreonine-4-phosphate dehydrogenase PdxA [Candidatus Avisuccinivibrio pullicola]